LKVSKLQGLPVPPTRIFLKTLLILWWWTLLMMKIMILFLILWWRTILLSELLILGRRVLYDRLLGKRPQVFTNNRLNIQ